MIARNTKLTTTMLWTLAAAYGVSLFANISLGLSIPIAVVLLLSVVFALIHGALRYSWSGIAVFIVISLVVSNILENTSILTGFSPYTFFSSCSLSSSGFVHPPARWRGLCLALITPRP